VPAAVRTAYLRCSSSALQVAAQHLLLTGALRSAVILASVLQEAASRHRRQQGEQSSKKAGLLHTDTFTQCRCMTTMSCYIYRICACYFLPHGCSRHLLFTSCRAVPCIWHRSRSKVSFQLAPARVSFLDSTDGSPAAGPSTSGPSTTESAYPAGSSAGSKGGSRHGSTSGQAISTAAGQLSHTQVMRGSVVGVPQSGVDLPQQSPDTVAGQPHGKGQGRRSATNSGSETGHSMAEGRCRRRSVVVKLKSSLMSVWDSAVQRLSVPHCPR
jgi:hypothetical protein